MSLPVVSSLSAKVEPFWASTQRALTIVEIEQVLSSAQAHAHLPDGSTLSLPLGGLFAVTPCHQKGRDGVQLTPVRENMHRVAVVWCQALASLPPKSLPRSQRPMIKILKRLPVEPTGNPAWDSGRALLLDGVVKTLWTALATATIEALQPLE